MFAWEPCNPQCCWRYLVDDPSEHKEWILRKWVWTGTNWQRKHFPGAERLKPADLATTAHQNLISFHPEVAFCSEYQNHSTHTVNMGDWEHSGRNLGDFSLLWSFRKSKARGRGWAPTQSKTNVASRQVCLRLCPVGTWKISEILQPLWALAPCLAVLTVIIIQS